jgi:hypothetical protein
MTRGQIAVPGSGDQRSTCSRPTSRSSARGFLLPGFCRVLQSSHNTIVFLHSISVVATHYAQPRSSTLGPALSAAKLDVRARAPTFDSRLNSPPSSSASDTTSPHRRHAAHNTSPRAPPSAATEPRRRTGTRHRRHAQGRVQTQDEEWRHGVDELQGHSGERWHPVRLEL